MNPVVRVVASPFCLANQQPQTGFEPIVYLGEGFRTNLRAAVSVGVRNCRCCGAGCHIGQDLVPLMCFIRARVWAGGSVPQERELQM